jgi:hypothetical protein
MFAGEVREITAYHVSREAPGTLIEFASRLSTAGGTVKLDGDPQHAGVHFRAHQEVAEETKSQTCFIRPDEIRSWDVKTRDARCVNLPWKRMSIVLDGQRYTIAYLDHSGNPKESRYGERDYGRFGSYFEYELTPEKPLELRYRIWTQAGEMTCQSIDRLAIDFTAPPSTTIKRMN